MAFSENYSLGTGSEDLEDKENDKIDFAVHLLSHLKHRPLSFKSARKLEAMKYKFLSPLGMYSQSSFKRKALQIHESKTPKTPPTKEAFYGVAPQGRKVHVAPQVLQEERAGNLFYGNYAPPDIPPVQSLRHLIIKCSKPFEKQLTCSDVDDGQSRLAMSKEDVENHIFPLLNEGDDPVQGIKVWTYDMDGKSYPMEFKIWVSKIHVLTGGWKGFCNEKGLVEKQDFVTIWAFRTEESLCFAIGSRRFPVFHAIKKKKLRHN